MISSNKAHATIDATLAAEPITNGSRLRAITLLFVLAVTSVPVAVLSHEGAHFLAGVVFQVPGLSFHSASVGYEHEKDFWRLVRDRRYLEARRMFPLGKIFVLELAGPGLSMCLITFCWWWYPRGRVHDSVVPALATASSMRLLAPLLFVIRTWGWLRSELPVGANDEYHLALLSGVPLLLLVTVEILFAATLLTIAYRRMMQWRRRDLVFIVPLAVVTGMFLFFAL